MKLKDGYVLRSVAGNYMVIPVGGGNPHLNKIINLNDTGAFLWEKLTKEADIETLAEAMCNEYEIDRASAVADIEKFVSMLKDNGFLAED